MPGNDVVQTSPARDLAPAAAGPEVARLAAAAVAYAGADMALNTRRAYESDWRDFTAWCGPRGAVALPASADVVALYLTDRASRCSVATLQRRIAAIRSRHRNEDILPPDSARLRAVWAGIRRTNGRPPSQKRAIITEDLKRIVRRLPATLTGARDKALLLVGFAAALRRSELAALVLDTGAGNRAPLRLRFVPEGLEVVIDRSKADQEGRGAIVGVPTGKTGLCPVKAVRSWLDLSGIRQGPIFRPIDRHGNLGPAAMSGQAAAAVVKRAGAKAQFDARSLGGHSLRAGLVTSAIMADVAVPVIMQQTRHARVEVLNRYVRQAERFSKNAAGKVGL